MLTTIPSHQTLRDGPYHLILQGQSLGVGWGGGSGAVAMLKKREIEVKIRTYTAFSFSEHCSKLANSAHLLRCIASCRHDWLLVRMRRHIMTGPQRHLRVAHITSLNVTTVKILIHLLCLFWKFSCFYTNPVRRFFNLERLRSSQLL